jgi:hypothetical protein
MHEAPHACPESQILQHCPAGVHVTRSGSARETGATTPTPSAISTATTGASCLTTKILVSPRATSAHAAHFTGRAHRFGSGLQRARRHGSPRNARAHAARSPPDARKTCADTHRLRDVAGSRSGARLRTVHDPRARARRAVVVSSQSAGSRAAGGGEAPRRRARVGATRSVDGLSSSTTRGARPASRTTSGT